MKNEETKQKQTLRKKGLTDLSSESWWSARIRFCEASRNSYPSFKVRNSKSSCFINCSWATILRATLTSTPYQAIKQRHKTTHTHTQTEKVEKAHEYIAIDFLK